MSEPQVVIRRHEHGTPGWTLHRLSCRYVRNRAGLKSPIYRAPEPLHRNTYGCKACKPYDDDADYKPARPYLRHPPLLEHAPQLRRCHNDADEWVPHEYRTVHTEHGDVIVPPTQRGKRKHDRKISIDSPHDHCTDQQQDIDELRARGYPNVRDDHCCRCYFDLDLFERSPL